METYSHITNILLAQSILYMLVTLLVLAKANLQQRSVDLFVAYASLTCAWVLVEVFRQTGWLNFVNNEAALVRVPLYGIFVSTILTPYMSRAFLRLPTGTKWGGWGWGVLWLLTLLLLDSNILGLSQIWSISRTDLVSILYLVGWAAFMLSATIITIRIYNRTQQPLHKNRIQYWLPALIFMTAGNFLLFANYLAFGINVQLLGVLIAAYAVITHRLPDIRHTTRRILRYTLITLVTVSIYTIGLVSMQYLFQTVPGYNPILAGAVISLVLVIISQPLLHWVQRLVNWLVFGTSYNTRQTLSEYSLRISNVLDLERLAAVALGLIQKTMDSNEGILFTVHHTIETAGENTFNLQAVQDSSTSIPQTISLPNHSPLATYLGQEHTPLTQYDIDLHPRFKDVSPTERSWFLDLGMDVYVPIYAQGLWIGLFTCGPKTSGDRYFQADLDLLNTLADQTAVALKNARLVEDLKKLNVTLKQAYADLNQANKRMQELDKLKSAFIGVITHELRTPFANTIFSLEILEQHGGKYLFDELQDQFNQVSNGVKTSKRMIDNLVTFATFLSKQGKLNLVEIDFSQLVQDGINPLKSLGEAIDISFQIEVSPNLPPIYGDQERLNDAIYHLLHNAIKFTKAGGAIWVRAYQTNNTLTFEVQDTGIGISAEVLPTLWEGFTQMADPHLRGVEGLGLGLALVKYIITAHSGQVGARSEEGVGSTFGFQLPLARKYLVD